MARETVVPVWIPDDPIIAVVGQSPGVVEARRGRPFVGPAGQAMREWVAEAGFDPEADVMWTNVVDTFKQDDPNHKPTARETRDGWVRILSELACVPDLKGVVLVGAYAAHLVFKGTMGQMEGREGRILDPDFDLDLPVWATWHPSAWLRADNRSRAAQIKRDAVNTLTAVFRSTREDGGGGWEEWLPDGPVVRRRSVVTQGAVDVETTGEKRTDTADPRRATFDLAAQWGFKSPDDGRIFLTPPTLKQGAEIDVHNVPYDGVVLGEWDVAFHCTKMLGHLNGLEDTTLKGMTQRYLNRPAMAMGEADARGLRGRYCLDDSRNTFDLRPLLYAMLPTPTQELYDTLERPLFPLWTKMTLERSFRLNAEPLLAAREQVAAECSAALDKATALLPRGRFVFRCSVCELDREHKQPGQKCVDDKNHRWTEMYDPDKGVNLNSPDQLLEAFHSLGVNVHSTEKEVLNMVRHPAAAAVVAYKKEAKRLGTYYDPLSQIAESGQRLGSVWRPTGARTGRVSSAYPNLMNQPEEMEQFLLGWAEDEVLLTYDNAQLEIRIAAHISQDPDLIRVCHEEDLHGSLQRVLGAPSRRDTKVWIFGTMYLGGPMAVMTQAAKFGMDMGWDEAQWIIDTIKDRMPHYFKVWAPSMLGRRVVEGLFGRVHWIPEEDSEDGMDRKAINAPTQGGAGDATKYQQRDLHLAGYRVVRQVHDSVTVSVPRVFEAEARHDVPRIMEAAVPGLDVPIKVELK